MPRLVRSQLPLSIHPHIKKSPYHRPSFTLQNLQFQYRQHGRLLQHHGPPGRLSPRMRATRYDPQAPQPQMIDKVHNSSPSVSSPPSSLVSVTPQAVVPRRSPAQLPQSTLHPRARKTSSSTSPLLFRHVHQKEQGKGIQTTNNRGTCICTAPQIIC